MAIVRLSSILSEIRGSVGCSTFQRSRYGLSLRQKPVPSFFMSENRYQISSVLRTVVLAWQNLSDVDRQQWFNFINFTGYSSKTSTGLALSPYNLFVAYQSLRLNSGLDLLSTLQYGPVENPDLSFQLFYVEPELGNPSDILLYIPFFSSYLDLDFTLSVSPIIFNSKQLQSGRFRNVSKIPDEPGMWLFGESYFTKFYRRPVIGDTLCLRITAFSLYSPVIFKTYSASAVVQALP